jgi:serine protease Do
VTIGIISCMRRYLPGHSQYSLWLQSCAPISPGNSGGPLVNTAGEVIGINTLGFMSGGDVGFAVPSATVKIVTEQLRRHGKADWCWTGIQLQPLKDFNKNIYFNASDGVIVAETDPESPARRAGILATDRIVRIGDTVVTAERDEDLPAVERLLGQLPLGQPVKIALVRDSKPLEVELTPREKGKVEGEELDCPRWDMTVKTINQFDNADLYLHRKKGVFIYGVKDQGNASSAGLHAQDIILKIDGQEVVTLEDVKAIHKTALANVDSKFRYVFEVLRNGLLRQVVLNFSRDYEKE